MYQRCLKCGRMIQRVNWLEAECFARKRVVRMEDYEERCAFFTDITQHPLDEVVHACEIALSWRVDAPVKRVVSDVLYKYDVLGAAAPRMVETYVEAIRSEVKEVV